MQNGLPVFMDSVPEYEVRNGRMYVTLGDFQLVMPLRIFLIGKERADAAIAKWQRQQRGKVVPLKRGRKHHAASS